MASKLELPEDVVGYILTSKEAGLSLPDRIRCLTVCQKWRGHLSKLPSVRAVSDPQKKSLVYFYQESAPRALVFDFTKPVGHTSEDQMMLEPTNLGPVQAFHNNKYLFTSAYSNNINLYDLENSKLIWTIENAHTENTVVLCLAKISWPGEAAIAGEDLRLGEPMPADLMAPAYHDVKIFSGGYDDYLVIHDFQSGRRLGKLVHKGKLLRAMGFTPNRRFFLTSSNNSQVIVWQADTLLDHEPRVHLVFTDHSKEALTIDIVDDETVVTSQMNIDRGVVVWKIETGEILHVLPAGGSWQITTTFDHRRGIFITAPYGGRKVSFWDPHTGQLVGEFPTTVEDMFVIPDSDFLVVWIGVHLKVVSLETYRQLFTIDLPTQINRLASPQIAF